MAHGDVLPGFEPHGKNEFLECLEEEEQILEEPIAVCGIALRFPQDASTEEGFWNMVRDKRNAMTEFPPERLNIDAFYHPHRNNALRMRGAHFLQEDTGLFDAGFFSITPTEAAAMDPMQRILLETTFHAFESGGIRLEDIRGSQTSVHTGCFTNDYLQLLMKDSDRLPPYTAISTQSMLANRLSWFFDLRGPSINLDSACSSSAVAVDLACQLLLSGRTDMGVVAGCNILLDPDFSMALSNMQMLSPDSRCFAFDHRANGYSRGEGVAVVVLKRLSDALRDHDTIRAVIRATGTNQDGRTPGITQPDPTAQTQLIRETYGRAGLSMKYTRFFEAHGTGTGIGDPVEISAIADSFSGHRNVSDPLYVGSAKTNVGHLEGASGIAGLLKAILVVESGVIPPNANFENINPKLAAYDYVIALPSNCTVWPPCKIRRASVNSFGYGGTNCHIVVDDASSYLGANNRAWNHPRCTAVSPNLINSSTDMTFRCQRPCESPAKTFELPKVLIWTAATDSALEKLISLWQDYYVKTSNTADQDPISNIAYTLDSRRSLLHWESFAIVSTTSECRTMKELASEPRERSQQPPRIAFIFTGQGAQWFAMARELFSFPVFMKSIQRAESVLNSLGCCWSVQGESLCNIPSPSPYLSLTRRSSLDELLRNEKDSNINHPTMAQTLTTIVQIGLVDLLGFVGLKPVAVVGHSMGEVAAAYCAGFLNRESALRLSYYRGFFTAMIPNRSSIEGAMLAVGLPPERVLTYFEKVAHRPSDFTGNLRISCINSPRSVTASGEVSQITALKHVLDSEGIFNRLLRVPVAYHSPQMELIVPDCLEHFGTLKPSASTVNVKMVSSVTGSLLSSKRACQPSYWTSNLVSPVLFSQAIERLCRDSAQAFRKKLDLSHHHTIAIDHIVEIGPHAALRLPILEILDNLQRRDDVKYLSALYRKQSASITALRLLGELHCCGYPVDLRRVNDPEPGLRSSRQALVDAPKYPFDHSTRYWAESALVQNYRLRAHGYIELLGCPSRGWNPIAPEWRCCVSTSDMPWLLDHKVNGKAIYPAAAMIIMATQGASQVAKAGHRIESFTLRNVRFESAIVVSHESRDLETRLQLFPLTSGPTTQSMRWQFSIYSVSAGHWSKNCRGIIEAHFHSEILTEERAEKASYYRRQFSAQSNGCHQYHDASAVYQSFSRNGHHYGPTFQGIAGVRYVSFDSVSAEVAISSALIDDGSAGPFVIHPATLDSFMQVALVTLSQVNTVIPTQAISGIQKLWISAESLHSRNSSLQVSTKLEAQTARKKLYSGFALNQERVPQLILEGLETTVVSTLDKVEDTSQYHQSWYSIDTVIDVEVLSGPKICEWLDRVCGTDPSGPSSFFRDLKDYLYCMIQHLYRCIEQSGTDPTQPHLRKYVSWMDWSLRQAKKHPSPGDKDALSSALEQQGFLGYFFVKVSQHALDVLQGRSDMVRLLFEDHLVDTFYEQQVSGSLFHQKLQVYLEALSCKHPSLDFLEVGAGTGSFTRHIINALTSSTCNTEVRMNSYCYTDISPAFFERARQQFSSASHKMRFAVLNVDKDPLTQGFQQHSFDVVVASDVLHVTKNLNHTLQRLRKLLKPGGRLILHEHTCPERIEVGFVFGLLPGWWPSSGDGRSMSPLLTEEMWDGLFRQNGFSGADFVLRDFVDEESHLMSIMCATAVESSMLAELPAITIAIEARSPLQKSVADVLMGQLKVHGYGDARLIDLSAALEGSSFMGVVITLFDLDRPILCRVDETGFERLKGLVLSTSKLLWVSNHDGLTADPSHGMIDGFARVFRIENINSKLATLSLATQNPMQKETSDILLSALQQLVHASGLDHPEDYIAKDGLLHIRRIYENETFKNTISEITSGERHIIGTVQSAKPFVIVSNGASSAQPLRVMKDYPATTTLGPDEVEIEVHAVGLNQLDTILVTGKASGIEVGRECAGIVARAGHYCTFTPGDRVCAFSSYAFKSIIRARSDLVARIPDHMSFEYAATLPQDYVIADYLIRESRVRENSVVVVCGGQSKIGRATLRVLRHLRARVVTTVPTRQDVADLSDVFPEIVCSTYSYFTERCNETYPAGVDLVIDFTDESLAQLTECVSKFGQIVSVKVNCETDLHPFRSTELPPTIGYKVLDMMSILQHRLTQLRLPHTPIQEMLHCSLEHQRPSIKTTKLSELSSLCVALRELRSDERAAVTYENEDKITMHLPITDNQLFDSSASYVISGGLGDLGRCVATWMVSRGARNLILLSRSGPRTETARATVERLKSLGAKVHTPQCDIAHLASVRAALQQCGDISAIKGCVQTSAVLQDVMYDKMSFQDWKTAVEPKVQGSWNLHEVLPKGMDFFLMASSLTGIMGQPTQINYAAGNTYQDALATYRIALGEKAVSLDFGILATGGLLSGDRKIYADRLQAEGIYSSLSESEILALFEYYCDPRLDAQEMRPQVVTGIIRSAVQERRAKGLPAAFSHPLWRQLLNKTYYNEVFQKDGAESNDIQASLSKATSLGEMGEIAANALADQFCSLALTPRAKINIDKPLHVAGADSLSAVYLRNWIMKHFGVDMAVFDILGDRSISELGSIVAKEWRTAGGG